MAEGDNWVCATCGAQFDATTEPPSACRICEDERQYIGADGERQHISGDGQHWTTVQGLVEEGRKNKVEEIEPGLVGIGTEPSFGIGQRAVLVQTDEGNILWDCISLLDQATIEAVKKLGGIRAIAISHPHFYSCMVEWSKAFGAPVYIHGWDQKWVTRRDGDIITWSGDSQELFGGCKLYRLGGHFPGSAVLHIPRTQEGKAVVLSGDTIQCTLRKNFVAYAYSYPTYIPLPASEVEKIRDKLGRMPQFEKIYGGWWNRKVMEKGRQVAIEGADRTLRALEGFYTRSYPDAGYDVTHRH